ncbi:P-loop containing nucleoside triphosphate hydrolase protein [Aspergillus carlsbadensis]|nr:P-loop containing nucleoside triphosphate hydrolase protein [Aspergillus carlsbadensis]
MTRIPRQKCKDSSKDLQQDKVEAEVPWSQVKMDDIFYDAPQVLPSQSASNTNIPLEQAPSGTNTALRDHFMRLMQAEREDKERLLAARREWESRNAAAEATGTDDTGDDQLDDDAEWDSGLWNQTLYRFKDSNEVFSEPPVWQRQEDASAEGRYTLQFSKEGPRVHDFLESNDITCLIFKTYSPGLLDRPLSRVERTIDGEPLISPESESLLFVSEDMIEAVEEYLSAQPDFPKLFPDFDARKEIYAPYLFWFTFRSGYPSALRSLSPRHRALIKDLEELILGQYGEEYACVDDQLLRGVVSAEAMKYLVKPGDVLVSEEDGVVQAYLAASWAKEVTIAISKADQHSGPRRWEISAWSYGVDGTFYIKDTTLEMELDFRSPGEKIDLRQLNKMPIQYTTLETSMALQERGKAYWWCREKRLVSYYGEAGAEYIESGERFMIDLETYKSLQISEQNLTESNPKRKKMSPLLMLFDDPPSAPYLFLFPPTIPGYSLSNKKWVNLEIDKIQSIQWDKRAFENLVVDEIDKELLKAAVATRRSLRRGIDILEGKDDGLKILLHGSSGTGKTFTAESLAELVEKPLYRLTCADFGTEPKEAERCLRSAFYFGKRWGCIILLEDMDIFLEEDTSRDVRHNALLAVILHALESYSDTVILTARQTNRLNEAFRSRIRLIFHYRNPDRSQRLRIWQNFIGQVKEVDQLKIDHERIDPHFDELAEIMMNGRQIRDTITTACECAVLQGQKLKAVGLKHVIKLAEKHGCGI